MPEFETQKEKPSSKPARWQSFGNLAQWASVGISTATFLLVVLQLSILTTNARETSARQIYSSYLDASYRYPDFLVPDYEEIRKDKKKLTQYKLYVSHLLWSYDEVFSAITEGWLERSLRFVNNGFRNKPVDDYSWLGAFYTDLEFHLPGLCDFADKKFFSEFGSYTEELVVAAMKNSSAASCKRRFQGD